MAEKFSRQTCIGVATLGRVCRRLLHYLSRFRDRLIGRTSAFGAEYRGSSPRPGTKFPRGNSLLCEEILDSHFAIVQQDNADQSDTKRPEAAHYVSRLIFGGKAHFQPARPSRGYSQYRERDVA